jgi:hypothetical protein
MMGAVVVVLVDSREWESVERTTLVEEVRRLQTLERDHADPPGKWALLNKFALGSTEFAVDTSIAECVQGSSEQEIVDAGAGEAEYTARRQISKIALLTGEVVGR